MVPEGQFPRMPALGNPVNRGALPLLEPITCNIY
jgi:hypothetical protein